MVPVTDRDAVRLLGEAVGVVDLLIPRGGRGLIESVVRHARVPVIKHYDGICALYVDTAAELVMAEKIAVNAKCSRPGVCNAIETLLVHRDVADKFLREAGRMLTDRGVKLRAEPRALAVLKKRSEEHTSELQSPDHLVCRLLLEKKKRQQNPHATDSRSPCPPRRVSRTYRRT